MNMVTVKINGIEYNLKGEEREEYLHKVAAYVDKKLKNIMSNNSRLSTSSAAVLTAVNAVDDLFKFNEEYSGVQSRLQELENNEKLLMEQLDTLKTQLQHQVKCNEELSERFKSRQGEELIKSKDEEIERLKKELSVFQETAQKQLKENNSMKSQIKELKFELVSSKYKIIDLQNKLLENQIDLAKVKRSNNPLLKTQK
jgi:cell division protein ZapA